MIHYFTFFLKEATYSIEKLIVSVQTIHKQLNDQISQSLKKLFKTNNLEKYLNLIFIFCKYFNI